MEDVKMTLRALRVNAGLTQEEAAKRLGISEETLANWERGRTFPDVRGVQRIESLYNYPYANINFFCDDVTDKPK